MGRRAGRRFSGWKVFLYRHEYGRSAVCRHPEDGRTRSLSFCVNPRADPLCRLHSRVPTAILQLRALPMWLRESLYVFDLKTGKSGNKWFPVMPDVEFPPMTPSRAIEITSFDGASCAPRCCTSPRARGRFQRSSKFHGGPSAQARRTYSGIRQYLVSKGCVVLVPNVRGSTGYGKHFAALDDMDLGGAPLKDVIAGKRWLAANASVSIRIGWRS